MLVELLTQEDLAGLRWKKSTKCKWPWWTRSGGVQIENKQNPPFSAYVLLNVFEHIPLYFCFQDRYPNAVYMSFQQVPTSNFLFFCLSQILSTLRLKFVLVQNISRLTDEGVWFVYEAII